MWRARLRAPELGTESTDSSVGRPTSGHATQSKLEASPDAGVTSDAPRFTKATKYHGLPF